MTLYSTNDQMASIQFTIGQLQCNAYWPILVIFTKAYARLPSPGFYVPEPRSLR